MSAVPASIREFHLRLLDLVPLARDAVLEGLPDVVIVLDSEDRVVDVNRAAASRLGSRRVDLVGRRADQALASWPALGAHVREGTVAPRTVEWSGPPPGWLEVSVSPLDDQLGRRAGRFSEVMALRPLPLAFLGGPPNAHASEGGTA